MLYFDTLASISFVFHCILLCCVLQARMALDKGAQAVIFDVSDDANAAAEVSV